jgi:hypothetical protein
MGVVSFTPRPLYPPRKKPLVPIGGGGGNCITQLGTCPSGNGLFLFKCLARMSPPPPTQPITKADLLLRKKETCPYIPCKCCCYFSKNPVIVVSLWYTQTQTHTHTHTLSLSLSRTFNVRVDQVKSICTKCHEFRMHTVLTVEPW